MTEQANTHKNLICGLNLNLTHPQLIRINFLLHDPSDPRISRGPRVYNRHPRISNA